MILETKVVVGLARQDEAAAVARLHLDTAVTAYRGIFPPEAPAPTEQEVLAQWNRAFADGRAVFVAHAGAEGRVVGVVTAGADPADATLGHLSRLYVDRPSWGRGIGRTLHDAALTQLAEAGFDDATLWVLERNDRARSWYERLGWAPTGERKPVYVAAGGGSSIDDVRYRISLTRRAGSNE